MNVELEDIYCFYIVFNLLYQKVKNNYQIVWK
jgi:hypothetical protein